MRIGHGTGHGTGRREVNDRVAPRDRVIEDVGVADVALHEVGVHADQVRGVPGGQVVEHPDPVPGRDQPAHQRRPDEPGPTGHQNSRDVTHEKRSVTVSAP